MGVVNLAFDGVALIGAIFIVHYLVSILLDDATNINFSTPILVVLVPSFVVYYGIPAQGLTLSIRVLLVIGFALIIAWILASKLTVFVWWEDILIGAVAVGSYLLIYSRVQRIWEKVFLME